MRLASFQEIIFFLSIFSDKRRTFDALFAQSAQKSLYTMGTQCSRDEQ